MRGGTYGRERVPRLGDAGCGGKPYECEHDGVGLQGHQRGLAKALGGGMQRPEAPYRFAGGGKGQEEPEKEDEQIDDDQSSHEAGEGQLRHHDGYEGEGEGAEGHGQRTHRRDEHGEGEGADHLRPRVGPVQVACALAEGFVEHR